MIKPGDWGPVRVLRGRYKGQMAYYDDDDEGRRGRAIIYIGEPFESDYILIPHAWLEPFDGPLAPLDAFVREHPDAAAQLGVVARRGT